MTVVAAPTIRIGTRGSALALIQAGLVADGLRSLGADVRVDTIVTDGDQRTPDTAWGEGAFVTAIERALTDGRIDIAVHSAKDVPTDEDPHLTIAAFLPRDMADDVLVLPVGRRIERLEDLPQGARVGTDSPRRSAFLRAARADLLVHPLHGNVDTRLRRLDAGETGALVLAAAGLRRLGRTDRISMVLPFELVPSAPGQGALAVQVRADDAATLAVVRHLDDAVTRRAVVAERALLADSGGGCRAPIGAFGRVVDGQLHLRAGFATADGSVAVTVSPVGIDDRDEAMIRATLGDLVDHAAAAALSLRRPRVIVTRPSGDAAALTLALVDRGFAPVAVPAIAIEPVDPGVIDTFVDRLPGADWVVVTSANAVRALAEAAHRRGVTLTAPGLRWAAVGAATGRALQAMGVTVVFRPGDATGAALAEGLPVAAGEIVLLPRGDLADEYLPRRLAERGARVDTVIVYRTVEAPLVSRPLISQALDEHPAAVVMSSGSAVRGWMQLARDAGVDDAARAVGIVAIGPTTVAEARRLGLVVAAVAADPHPAAVADAVIAGTQILQETR